MEAEALQWRATRTRLLYPLLGTLSLLAILYLNFSDNPIAFPRFLLSQPKMGFVATNSTHFVVDDGEGAGRSNPTALYVNGWNSYWLMEESVWESSRSKVSRMLKMGAQMGLTVCRTWAFSDGSASDSLQTSPGVFNKRVFQGLDYVIVEARKNRVRLILSLVNNLNAFGGKAQYVKWAREAGVNVSSSDDSFFTNPTVKDYYKAFVKAIVTRRNSISGIKYSEEPSIFAWELMNEPRCTSDSCPHALQAWISEMAAYIKSLDQKHLVTVGLEGFYGLNTTEKSGVNPGDWASLLGSDFLENSASYNIDFASVHAYPDSWIPEADMEAKVQYLSQWVDSHINDGENKLKKPILFTEIGSALNLTKQGTYDRDAFFKTVYDKVYESAKKKQAGAGALIWQLLVEDMEQQYGDRFSFIAWDRPSTYKLIKEQSCRLSRVSEANQMNKTLHHDHDPCLGMAS